jgi:hypothetical protein
MIYLSNIYFPFFKRYSYGNKLTDLQSRLAQDFVPFPSIAEVPFNCEISISKVLQGEDKFLLNKTLIFL